MIKTIYLKYFRSHEELEITLSKGLQYMKGANEAGKSTIFEAITYNWFGSKALTTPLENIVTYGKKKSDMKTSITFSVMGREFVSTRSTSGAEVTCEGKVMCSGQKDVTTYIEELFGIPSGTAHMLLIARQNEIRGILEDGRAHEFIEKLADFSEIDSLVDTLQRKLNTGSVGPAKQAVESAVARFEIMVQPVKPTAPDLSELESERKTIKDDLANVESRLYKDSKSLKEHEVRNKEKEVLIKDLADSKLAISMIESEIKAMANPVVDTTLISKVRSDIEDMENADVVFESFSEFKTLPDYPEEYWDENRESFDKEVAATTKNKFDIESKLAQTKTDILIQKSKVITDRNCPTCNTELKDVDTINAGIAHNVSELGKLVTRYKDELDELHQTLAIYRGIEEINNIYIGFLTSQPEGLLSVDESCVPIKLSWVGEDPKAPDQKAYNDAVAMLSTLEFNKRTAENNEARLLELETQITKHRTKILTLEKQDLTLTSVDELKIGISNSQTNKNILSDKLVVVNNEIAKLTNNYEIATTAYNGEVRAYETARSLVAESKAALKSLEENNALLKAVRVARVEVTDHIWNMVLKSITNYFNTLRGSTSVITKDEKGFKCDGRTTADLSGSTLDILGLAIRFALTKMFLPGVSIQLLDEPSAGCDAERSMSLMGFVAASGFDQTLIVTHRQDDEVAADKLIQLER